MPTQRLTGTRGTSHDLIFYGRRTQRGGRLAQVVAIDEQVAGGPQGSLGLAMATAVGDPLDPDPVFPWASFATYVGVRSRFFDEFFASVLGGPAATRLRQVVLLAAGLDTRAFRLDWPIDVTLYEVDAPLVLGFKDLVLASSAARPRCARCTVAADLREDWPLALRAVGFNPAQPTAWLAEGLLSYLTDEEKVSLLATVHDLSAPGSEIAVEHLSAGVESLRAYATFQEAAEHHDVEFDATTLWTGDQRADPVPWLVSRDWSVTISPITTVAERYGRPLSAALPESMLATVLIQAGYRHGSA